MSALVLVSDLMMQSQIDGGGTRAGIAVQTVRTSEILLKTLETRQPRLVVLDLSHPGIAPQELVPAIRSLAPECTVVAFGPHVHKELLIAAAEAGCDLVISRGQFHSQMVEILERFAA